jgi:F0F1-type ATP synthase membrane subunit a
MISHLVPQSSPRLLIFPLILIETSSSLIRPFTLGIRLAANIMRGHLILALARTLILGLILVLILEILVSFIQAFVFCTLINIYD